MLGTACGVQDNTVETPVRLRFPGCDRDTYLRSNDEIGALPATSTTEAPVVGGDVATMNPPTWHQRSSATMEALPQQSQRVQPLNRLRPAPLKLPQK